MTITQNEKKKYLIIIDNEKQSIVCCRTLMYSYFLTFIKVVMATEYFWKTKKYLLNLYCVIEISFIVKILQIIKLLI